MFYETMKLTTAVNGLRYICFVAVDVILVFKAQRKLKNMKYFFILFLFHLILEYLKYCTQLKIKIKFCGRNRKLNNSLPFLLL